MENKTKKAKREALTQKPPQYNLCMASMEKAAAAHTIRINRSDSSIGVENSHQTATHNNNHHFPEGKNQ